MNREHRSYRSGGDEEVCGGLRRHLRRQEERQKGGENPCQGRRRQEEKEGEEEVTERASCSRPLRGRLQNGASRLRPALFLSSHWLARTKHSAVDVALPLQQLGVALVELLRQPLPALRIVQRDVKASPLFRSQLIEI